MFPNHQDLLLASYNAGEGAVQQYKNQIPPYPETRNYVQLVTQFYQLYQGGTVTGKYQAKVFTRSGPTAKRLYMTLPGRRSMPVSPVAYND